MCYRILASRRAALLLPILSALLSLFWTTPSHCQIDARHPIHYPVHGTSQRLEMIVNSSRILTMKGKIPKAQVNNPEVISLTPLSATQIQVSAIKTGVTQVNLWDERETVYTVDVVVLGDARELDMVLKAEFPSATLKIRPMNSSVLISGFVPQPDMVHRITSIAEDYYPKVVDNMIVGGVQTVLLQVKVMEVSRNKLRKLGVDWSHVNGNDFVVSSVSGLINAAAASTGTTLAGTGMDSVRLGIVGDSSTFLAFVEALQQRNIVKVLAEPNLVTMSGRPASFMVGGEFPILVPSGTIGTATIEFREFGTRIDFVPVVLGNGAIRLEVRPSLTEIDESRNVTAGTITVPALRTRTVDTAVELNAGQTLALAGLIQERVESENKGLPWVSDIPYVGSVFRRVEENVNEIELLVLVTPQLVDAMDPHEVPTCLPGQSTTVPNDHEFFLKGYLEVPRGCHDENCVNCQANFHSQAYESTELTVPEAAVDYNIISPPSMQAVPTHPDPGPPSEIQLDVGPDHVQTGYSPSPINNSITVTVTDIPQNRQDQSRVDVHSQSSQNGLHHKQLSSTTQSGESTKFAPKLIGPVGYDVQE